MNPTTSKLLIITIPLIMLTACGSSTSQAVEVSSTAPPTATTMPGPELTSTPLPENTAIAEPVLENTAIPAETPLPDRLVDPHGVEMVLIPEGEFTMGVPIGLNDERPAHPVYLDAYYIDLTEATNKQYQACVAVGACDPPQRTDCCTENPSLTPIWPDYFGNPEYDNYPAIFLRWSDAYTYCQWRGAHLPYEAEWEKAARGTDERVYPWGNEEPRPGLLNYYWVPDEFEERPLYTTSPVGSYPDGDSPYGVQDMAGNVYEWVQDWYAQYYYEVSPYENPTGPANGSYKVSRGGSFFNQAPRQRAVGRNNAWLPVDSFHFDGGVRCAVSPASQ